MNIQQDAKNVGVRTNGSGAAALLAAGIGCFAVAALAFAADKSAALKAAFIFYKPTGPLSGVTISALVAWLIIWAALHTRWHKQTVVLGPIRATALILLVLSLLLTFPPLADLL